MALLELPLELFLEIGRGLDTRSFVRLCSTSRAVRQTLQGEQLTWLVQHYAERHPSRVAVIRASNPLVLSHVLIYAVGRYGYSRNLVQPLLNGGASFRDASCHSFLWDCIRAHSHPGRLIFALRHGALLGADACRVRVLLKGAIVHRGTAGGHVRTLLQNTTADDLTWVIDHLIAEAGDHPYYWGYVQFLIDKGALLSTKAQTVMDTQSKWIMHPPVTGPFIRRKEISYISVLQIMRTRLDGSGSDADLAPLLPYAISLAELSGGINALLQTAILRWAAIPLACYLLRHGASLDDIACGKESLPSLVLSSKLEVSRRVKAIEFLLEQGMFLNDEYKGYEKHLKDLFLHYGPGPEIEQVEIDYGITLESIDGGLNAMLATCIFEPSEPGPRVNYLRQRGATLENDPKIHELIDRVFHQYGPGPRMELLIEMGACLDYGSRGIDSFLESTYWRFGSGRRVDWLLQQGAWWPQGEPPTRLLLPGERMLADYHMQLMLLEQQNRNRRLLAQQQSQN